jgi:hypothetical protein
MWQVHHLCLTLILWLEAFKILEDLAAVANSGCHIILFNNISYLQSLINLKNRKKLRIFNCD